MFNLSMILLAWWGNIPLAEEEPAIGGTWFWILLILILVVLPILVVWLGPRLRKDQESGGGGTPAVETRAEPIQPAPVAEPHKPDDLKRIEGIGPKISSVLQAAGITTFAELAATDVEHLEGILAPDARLRLANPTTWPEQAALAAAGDWDALQKLQDSLKGGLPS